MEHKKYIITNEATLLDAIKALNNLSSEDSMTLFIVNSEGKPIGTLTDGDVRRKLIEGISLESNISLVMNAKFKYMRSLDIDVTKIREYKEKGITLIPILNEEGAIEKILNFKKMKSYLPVDAVLMAGGKGERLRPLTDKIPKPLIKVGEKCIIDHNIDRLSLFGIDKFHITVNYLKEQIKEHIDKYPNKDIDISSVNEPCYLGTIGSIKFIKEFKHDTVLVMNSDLFTNIDYEDFYLHFKESNADISVAAIPHSISIPYGVFELEGRNICGLNEKPIYNHYINAGIYLIKKELLDLIPQDEFFNATDFITLLIEKKKTVIRYPMSGYWIDIGKHEELNRARDLVKHIF